MLTVALEVDRDTGTIAAADVLMHSRLVREYLASLLVGRSLLTELSSISRDIEAHFHSTSQRAVIQAVYDAAQKYLALVSTSQAANAKRWSTRSELRFAYLTLGYSNSYLKYSVRGAVDTATKFGASIDVFDAAFDVKVQLSQIEKALNSGLYNAFVVCPLDGVAATSTLMKAAKDKGVLIAVINAPLGGRDLCSGDELWEPGTVTFVGGQTRDVYTEWLQMLLGMAAETNPEGGEAAAITGPRVGANSRCMNKALMDLLPNSNIDLVANVETNYTTAEAYLRTKELLGEHKGLKFVFSNYSGMTQGILKAVGEAGLTHKVRIGDFGGNKWSLSAVRAGTVDMTAIMLPYTESQRAVLAVVDKLRGKDVPKFIDLSKDPSLPGTPFVTLDNVHMFTPQYG